MTVDGLVGRRKQAIGTYEEDGQVLTMQVTVTQHHSTPALVSVIKSDNLVIAMARKIDDRTL